MTGGRLSRREVLRGACGVAVAAALGGCTRPAPSAVPATAQGSAGATPTVPLTTATEPEIDALVARVSAALAAPDPVPFLGLIGSADPSLWRRIHAGVHAVPMSRLALTRQAHGLVESDLRAEGPLTVTVAGLLEHQIAGVDALPVLQHLVLVVAKSAPGADLRLDNLRFGTAQPYQPWEVADVAVRDLPHVVLQGRAADAAALDANAADIEAGVARAYASIPDHQAAPKLSYLWGWEGASEPQDGRMVYGSSRVVDAAGVTYRAETTDPNRPARRIVLLPASEQRVALVSTHEAVHAITQVWGTVESGYAFVEEGYATWVEYLDQPWTVKWSAVVGLVDEAVATRLWHPSFYAGADLGKRYSLAWSFFVWVAETRDRATVHALARAAHQQHRLDDALQAVLGASLDALLPPWAAWVKSHA